MVSLEQIDLNSLKELKEDELKTLKIDVINSNDLVSIPPLLLPEVFYDKYYFVSYGINN